MPHAAIANSARGRLSVLLARGFGEDCPMSVAPVVVPEIWVACFLHHRAAIPPDAVVVDFQAFAVWYLRNERQAASIADGDVLVCRIIALAFGRSGKHTWCKRSVVAGHGRDVISCPCDNTCR